MELRRSFSFYGDHDEGGGGRGGGGPQHHSGLRRSNSCRLLSESITDECARVAAYERLSGSMRLSSDRDISCLGCLQESNKKGGSKALALLGKIFNHRKAEGGPDRRPETDMAVAEERKVKKRSSWLPDPERRWPVQGW
ncbi:hypothetical protein SAY86_023917 [Trapa natans]|uniref:Uncharacterized protein n=1 Tax=Trapa natans TaxID=22666 RepID=A0AAN7LVN8_TRANT|nr:hypothetical protein SAY86_023917 [Trapa natans]